jgi:uncharacterized protein
MARKEEVAQIVWLGLLAVGAVLWTVNDTRQYRELQQATETKARQAFFWRWTVQSFVFLCGASVVTLWMVGRLEHAMALPVEFAALAPERLAAARPVPNSPDRTIGMTVGFAMATAVMLVWWMRRLRALTTPVVGDVAALIPRTVGERWAALALSINAGFSEELFFRLALPLLLASVTGSVAAGIGLSIVAFGLIHWYQGWRGVLATMFLGGLLTLVYITSGSLLRVMVTHALIDVVGLLVRPMLATAWAERRAA